MFKLYISEEKHTMHKVLHSCLSDILAILHFYFCSHYFINGGFFVSDTQLLDNVDKIRHIPATIVQGRYDIVCPTETAWLLHKVRNSIFFVF